MHLACTSHAHVMRAVHLENVNLANLPGILAYLHHEVVGDACGTGSSAYECSWRKFGITKVNRYVLTMRSTREAFDAWTAPEIHMPHGVGHQFGM